MNTFTFPASLHTSTPADGYRLARELAERALSERVGTQSDMASHLATNAVPSVEALTAAYFQAVASINTGWPR